MNENVKKWVEALRSGEFTQTGGRLQDNEGYCCLGVAVRVWEKETGGTAVECEGYLKGGTLNSQSRSVQEWLGLNSPTGDYIPEGGCNSTSIVVLNDHHKKTFKEIANIIESKPKGLFKDD